MAKEKYTRDEIMQAIRKQGNDLANHEKECQNHRNYLGERLGKIDNDIGSVNTKLDSNLKWTAGIIVAALLALGQGWFDKADAPINSVQDGKTRVIVMDTEGNIISSK